jgi:hypothetical protein
MSSVQSSTSTRRSPWRRRLAWPILIIAVAIPVAFISGRLERERMTAAEAYGQAVATWGARTECPSWLSDSAAHPILLLDLSKRLSDLGPITEPVTVLARLEETGATGFRWRVQLIWPELPSIDLLLGFDDLGTTPRLIGVGGSPPAPKEATP